MRTLDAIAEVALHRHHRVHRRDQLLDRNEADHVGETRIGLRRLIGAAHAAADRDVEALQLAARHDGDKAEILRIDVDVVARRNDEADLELAGHVGAPVERLLRLLALAASRAVPDFVIGARFRDRMIAGLLRQRIDLGVNLRELRIDRAHHAARIVAAGGAGIEQHVAQALHQRLQILLHHMVELEGLPRRQPQHLSAMAAAKIVELQPLCRAQHAARNAHARHEGERRLQLLAAALVADVAIVLLIDAVKLHQLVVAEDNGAGDRIIQALADGAAQVVAVRLQRFVGAELVERLRKIAAAIGRRARRRCHCSPQ